MFGFSRKPAQTVTTAPTAHDIYMANNGRDIERNGLDNDGWGSSTANKSAHYRFGTESGYNND
jgi:hypothetical protein